MNFVIFSYSFPPRSDAEAFCSARFASALVRVGHRVHVVTMDHPKAISAEMYNFLVDDRIRITRVPLAPDGKPWLSRVRYRIDGRECANIAASIKMLKKILKETADPILLCRTMPLASNIIGWYCRRYAKKWIAHFSDPSPWNAGNAKTFLGRLREKLTVTWTRRIIRDCDMVSLTCENVRRFFHERYGRVYDDKPVVVAPHIGEPLAPQHGEWNRSVSNKLVVHAGGINFERGVRQLVTALQTLNERGKKVDFIQIGEVDHAVAEFLEGFSFARVLPSVDPGMATAISSKADVLFIPDMRTPLPYIPFLPSKFVYQVYGDVPIVAYTMAGSAMATYARNFPESGVLFADMDEADSLVDSLIQALNLDRRSVDRTSLRKEFSQSQVIEDFIRAVEKLGLR